MTSEVIEQLLLAGILGLSGQAIRSVVGLKKMYDEAVKVNKKGKELFEGNTILTSLLLGFVAGILAVIPMSNFKDDFFSGADTKQHLIAIIAAGYAGTDFIEGFVRKYLPDNSTQTDNGGAQQVDSYTQSSQSVKTPQIPTPRKGGISHP